MTLSILIYIINYHVMDVPISINRFGLNVSHFNYPYTIKWSIPSKKMGKLPYATAESVQNVKKKLYHRISLSSNRGNGCRPYQRLGGPRSRVDIYSHSSVAVFRMSR